MNPVYTYMLIFGAQTIQLMLITYKTILTARNERKLNTFLTLFQEALGLVSSGLVIIGNGNLLLRVGWFVLGCGLGCFLGMVIDEALAVGTNMVTVIVERKEADRIATLIRERGFALTTIDAQSSDTKNKNRTILMIALKRKKERKLINQILSNENDIILIDDSINAVGGYY